MIASLFGLQDRVNDSDLSNHSRRPSIVYNVWPPTPLVLTAPCLRVLSKRTPSPRPFANTVGNLSRVTASRAGPQTTVNSQTDAIMESRLLWLSALILATTTVCLLAGDGKSRVLFLLSCFVIFPHQFSHYSKIIMMRHVTVGNALHSQLLHRNVCHFPFSEPMTVLTRPNLEHTRIVRPISDASIHASIVFFILRAAPILGKTV